jgi:hypothetical protein
MYRGSRKHVLDWVERPQFADELAALAPTSAISVPAESKWMPQSKVNSAEARLETFGPDWLPEIHVWDNLANWWLFHQRGANTPNWDIALGCSIENRPGLILVEAKANWPELGTAGKGLSPDATINSRENHARIGGAIGEACDGWRQIDSRVSISRDSHYQLANRLAFTWKLATLGIPVVLIYVGFTGDEGIRADAGVPFANDADWQLAFAKYVEGTVPLELFDRRLEFGGTPVWLLSRSRPVLEQSPELQR